MLPQNEITAAAALRDLTHAEPRVREQAAAALGYAPAAERESAVAALRRALADDNGAVRYAAALSLGELEDRGAFEALRDQLEDGDPMARQAAAIALGRIGEPRAFEPLAQALAQGPPEVRYQAVASLAEIDSGRAYDLLVGALADDDADVRGSAAAALGDHGDPRARDALADLLTETHATCRFEAAFALARFGDRRATPALLGFLGDRDFALTALEGLTLLRDPAALDPALRLARKLFAQPVVKVRAAAVVAALGDAEGRDLLHKAVTHRREEVRALAIQTLGEIADEWATSELRALRRSADGEELREMIDDAMARALRGEER
ncbi:MAG TPA: HEAT repeat domain-containing protein [Polyangia bacterium]|jgi:HEAT repeat protein